ncbi:MAG: M23 family metallopeptidase, partial [Limisphaerales bacterium]
MRNTRTRIHEGIDIRALHRDNRNEPTDLVQAARNGVVTHINSNVAASNYGKYIVLRHVIEGLQAYSLYAHLSEIAEGLKVDQSVTGGDTLGILGRTTNTKDAISKDRAHLHFEIGLQINTRFESWFQHWYTGGKNHHGAWNGMNLLGLDAADILQQDTAGNFNFTSHISRQPVLCRVRIHQAQLEWVE